jgi:hypothetical protein
MAWNRSTESVHGQREAESKTCKRRKHGKHGKRGAKSDTELSMSMRMGRKAPP